MFPPYVLIDRKTPLRLTAFITLFCFTFSNLGNTSALAFDNAKTAVITPEISPEEISKITLPEPLGKVQETFSGNQGKAVILIQDAHAVPEAQENISQILGHLNTAYGVRLTALEGALSKLDPLLLKNFPDKKLLQTVLKEYADRGEIPGGSAAAILNPGTMAYYGIEDWVLYETGVRLFNEAMNQAPQLEEALASVRNSLEEKKRATYSPELLAFDKAVTSFHSGDLDFVQLLKQFAPPVIANNDSTLGLLWHEIQNGEARDEALKKNLEDYAQRFSKWLKVPGTFSRPGPEKVPGTFSSHGAARKLEMTFQENYQAWRTQSLSAAGFAKFLEEARQQAEFPEGLSLDLRHASGVQRKIEAIEGTKLFAELEAWLSGAESQLTVTDEMKRLAAEAKTLRLLERMAKLELSSADWNQVRDLGTHYLIGLGQLSNVSLNLWKKMETHRKFYESAESRDRVFRKRVLELMKKEKTPVSALVAGGFHSQALMESFRKQGISYALVMPAIKEMPKETDSAGSPQAHYREHMRGEVSWKSYFEIENGRVSMYKAFVRAVRDKLISEYGSNGVSEKNLLPRYPDTPTHRYIIKEWRDAILRHLAAKNQLDRAWSYTRFLDEVSKKSGDQSYHALWMANIERFIEGLRHLKSTHRLTPDNIVGLIPSAVGSATTDCTYTITDPQAGFYINLSAANLDVEPALTVSRTSIAQAETNHEALPSTRSELREPFDGKDEPGAKKPDHFPMRDQLRTLEALLNQYKHTRNSEVARKFREFYDQTLREYFRLLKKSEPLPNPVENTEAFKTWQQLKRLWENFHNAQPILRWKQQVFVSGLAVGGLTFFGLSGDWVTSLWGTLVGGAVTQIFLVAMQVHFHFKHVSSIRELRSTEANKIKLNWSPPHGLHGPRSEARGKAVSKYRRMGVSERKVSGTPAPRHPDTTIENPRSEAHDLNLNPAKGGTEEWAKGQVFSPPPRVTVSPRPSRRSEARKGVEDLISFQVGNWEQIRRKGAFFFDVQSTLLARGQQATEQILEGLAWLLSEGIPVVISSGNTIKEIENQVVGPLKEYLKTQGNLNVMAKLLGYSSTGTVKTYYDETGIGRTDPSYTEGSALPDGTVELVLKGLRSFLRRTLDTAAGANYRDLAQNIKDLHEADRSRYPGVAQYRYPLSENSGNFNPTAVSMDDLLDPNKRLELDAPFPRIDARTPGGQPSTLSIGALPPDYRMAIAKGIREDAAKINAEDAARIFGVVKMQPSGKGTLTITTREKGFTVEDGLKHFDKETEWSLFAGDEVYFKLDPISGENQEGNDASVLNEKDHASLQTLRVLALNPKEPEGLSESQQARVFYAGEKETGTGKYLTRLKQAVLQARLRSEARSTSSVLRPEQASARRRAEARQNGEGEGEKEEELLQHLTPASLVGPKEELAWRHLIRNFIRGGAHSEDLEKFRDDIQARLERGEGEEEKRIALKALELLEYSYPELSVPGVFSHLTGMLLSLKVPVRAGGAVSLQRIPPEKWIEFLADAAVAGLTGRLAIAVSNWAGESDPWEEISQERWVQSTAGDTISYRHEMPRTFLEGGAYSEAGGAMEDFARHMIAQMGRQHVGRHGIVARVYNLGILRNRPEHSAQLYRFSNEELPVGSFPGHPPIKESLQDYFNRTSVFEIEPLFKSQTPFLFHERTKRAIHLLLAQGVAHLDLNAILGGWLNGKRLDHGEEWEESPWNVANQIAQVLESAARQIEELKKVTEGYGYDDLHFRVWAAGNEVQIDMHVVDEEGTTDSIGYAWLSRKDEKPVWTVEWFDESRLTEEETGIETSEGTHRLIFQFPRVFTGKRRLHREGQEIRSRVVQWLQRMPQAGRTFTASIIPNHQVNRDQEYIIQNLTQPFERPKHLSSDRLEGLKFIPTLTMSESHGQLELRMPLFFLRDSEFVEIVGNLLAQGETGLDLLGFFDQNYLNDENVRRLKTLLRNRIGRKNDPDAAGRSEARLPAGQADSTPAFFGLRSGQAIEIEGAALSKAWEEVSVPRRRAEARVEKQDAATGGMGEWPKDKVFSPPHRVTVSLRQFSSRAEARKAAELLHGAKRMVQGAELLRAAAGVRSEMRNDPKRMSNRINAAAAETKWYADLYARHQQAQEGDLSHFLHLVQMLYLDILKKRQGWKDWEKDKALSYFVQFLREHLNIEAHLVEYAKILPLWTQNEENRGGIYPLLIKMTDRRMPWWVRHQATFQLNHRRSSPFPLFWENYSESLPGRFASDEDFASDLIQRIRKLKLPEQYPLYDRRDILQALSALATLGVRRAFQGHEAFLFDALQPILGSNNKAYKLATSGFASEVDDLDSRQASLFYDHKKSGGFFSTSYPSFLAGRSYKGIISFQHQRYVFSEKFLRHEEAHLRFKQLGIFDLLASGMFMKQGVIREWVDGWEAEFLQEGTKDPDLRLHLCRFLLDLLFLLQDEARSYLAEDGTLDSKFWAWHASHYGGDLAQSVLSRIPARDKLLEKLVSEEGLFSKSMVHFSNALAAKASFVKSGLKQDAADLTAYELLFQDERQLTRNATPHSLEFEKKPALEFARMHWMSLYAVILGPIGYPQFFALFTEAQSRESVQAQAEVRSEARQALEGTARESRPEQPARGEARTQRSEEEIVNPYASPSTPEEPPQKKTVKLGTLLRGLNSIFFAPLAGLTILFNLTAEVVSVWLTVDFIMAVHSSVLKRHPEDISAKARLTPIFFSITSLTLLFSYFFLLHATQQLSFRDFPASNYLLAAPFLVVHLYIRKLAEQKLGKQKRAGELQQKPGPFSQNRFADTGSPQAVRRSETRSYDDYAQLLRTYVRNNRLYHWTWMGALWKTVFQSEGKMRKGNFFSGRLLPQAIAVGLKLPARVKQTKAIQVVFDVDRWIMQQIKFIPDGGSIVALQIVPLAALTDDSKRELIEELIRLEEDDSNQYPIHETKALAAALGFEDLQQLNTALGLDVKPRPEAHPELRSEARLAQNEGEVRHGRLAQPSAVAARKRNAGGGWRVGGRRKENPGMGLENFLHSASELYGRRSESRTKVRHHERLSYIHLVDLSRLSIEGLKAVIEPLKIAIQLRPEKEWRKPWWFYVLVPGLVVLELGVVLGATVSYMIWKKTRKELEIGKLNERILDLTRGDDFRTSALHFIEGILLYAENPENPAEQAAAFEILRVISWDVPSVHAVLKSLEGKIQDPEKAFHAELFGGEPHDSTPMPDTYYKTLYKTAAHRAESEPALSASSGRSEVRSAQVTAETPIEIAAVHPMPPGAERQRMISQIKALAAALVSYVGPMAEKHLHYFLNHGFVFAATRPTKEGPQLPGYRVAQKDGEMIAAGVQGIFIQQIGVSEKFRRRVEGRRKNLWLNQWRRVSSFFEKLKRISNFLRILSPINPITELLAGRLRHAISTFFISNPKKLMAGISTTGTSIMLLADTISAFSFAPETLQPSASAISGGSVDTLAPVSTPIKTLRSLRELFSRVSKAMILFVGSLPRFMGIVMVLESVGITLGKISLGAIDHHGSPVLYRQFQDFIRRRAVSNQSSSKNRGHDRVRPFDFDEQPSSLMFKPVANRFNFFDSTFWNSHHRNILRSSDTGRNLSNSSAPVNINKRNKFINPNTYPTSLPFKTLAPRHDLNSRLQPEQVARVRSLRQRTSAINASADSSGRPPPGLRRIRPDGFAVGSVAKTRRRFSGEAPPAQQWRGRSEARGRARWTIDEGTKDAKRFLQKSRHSSLVTRPSDVYRQAAASLAPWVRAEVREALLREAAPKIAESFAKNSEIVEVRIYQEVLRLGWLATQTTMPFPRPFDFAQGGEPVEPKRESTSVGFMDPRGSTSSPSSRAGSRDFRGDDKKTKVPLAIRFPEKGLDPAIVRGLLDFIVAHQAHITEVVLDGKVPSVLVEALHGMPGILTRHSSVARPTFKMLSSDSKAKAALLSFEEGPAAEIFQMLWLKGYEELQVEELYDVGRNAGKVLFELGQVLNQGESAGRDSVELKNELARVLASLWNIDAGSIFSSRAGGVLGLDAAFMARLEIQIMADKIASLAA